MSFSYYQLTVPVFAKMLTNLSHCLDKGVEYADSKKFDPTVLLQSRLAPDMYPLTKQIQISTDMAKFCVSRLSGVDAPKFADDETTVEQLKQRIATTIAYINSVPESAFADADSREIRLPWKPDDPMKADFYLTNFVLPNVFFHITTSYAILRNNGVPVGKADYTG